MGPVAPKIYFRLFELISKHKLHHISSCVTALPVLMHMHEMAKGGDNIVLSAGHAGLALYVVKEYFSKGAIDAEDLLEKHGVHPHKDVVNGIPCSTGSLGMGIGIACGMAMGNPQKDTHCMITDGEAAEGAVWETLRFIHANKISNLKVYVNMNGYCAYDKVDREYLNSVLRAMCPSIFIADTHLLHNHFELDGVTGHYENIDQYSKRITKPLSDIIWTL